jgi:hypothetical protein
MDANEGEKVRREISRACIAAAWVACLRADDDLWAAVVDICCRLDDGGTPAGPLVDAVLRAVVERFRRAEC